MIGFWFLGPARSIGRKASTFNQMIIYPGYCGDDGSFRRPPLEEQQDTGEPDVVGERIATRIIEQQDSESAIRHACWKPRAAGDFALAATTLLAARSQSGLAEGSLLTARIRANCGASR
jgi:hypothetical protein